MSRVFHEAGANAGSTSLLTFAGPLAAGIEGGRFRMTLAATIAHAVAMPAPTAQNDRWKMNMTCGSRMNGGSNPRWCLPADAG
jgi:hypothetical protein